MPDTVVSIPDAPTLDGVGLTDLGQVCFRMIDAALDERQTLDNNLVEWNNMLELLTGPKTWPWPNSANAIVPVLPAHLNTLAALIAGQTLTNHFYMVKGMSSEAMQKAHLVEQYLNDQFVQARGDSTWWQIHRDWIRIALRDGTGIVEALWKKAQTEMDIAILEPMEEDGIPVLDLNTGQQRYKTVKKKIKTGDYDDVEVNIVELRDFVMMPQESRSINNAPGVARKLYLYEDQLRAMCKSKDNSNGVLIKEQVDAIMPYAPLGTTELITDRQDPDSYTAGRQISLGQGQGPMNSEFFANRGPFLIWRCHTRQFDLDNDGKPEENIVYIHYNSMKCIGYARNPYWAQERPFFSYTPEPRPNRAIGWSLPERLSVLISEISAGHNQRRDAIDLSLSPPKWMRRGSLLQNNNFQWQPGATWESDDPKNEFGVYDLPAVDFGPSFQTEELDLKYAEMLTGASGPSTGQGVGDRASATEVRAVSGGQNLRANEYANYFRIPAIALIRFIVKLKRQYGKSEQDFAEDPGSPDIVETKDGLVPITKELLSLPFNISVAGASDPTDSLTRRQDWMSLYTVLMQNPDVAGDDVKRYKIESGMVSSFNLDPVDILGTEEEAEQRKAAKAQAAQQQAALAAQGIGTPGTPGQPGAAGGNGRSGQPHIAGTSGQPGA